MRRGDKLRWSVLFAILCCNYCGSKLWGQDLRVYEHFDKGALQLRWVVEDAEKWAQAAETGFKILRKNLDNGNERTFEIKNQTARYLEINKESNDPRLYVAALLDAEVSDRQFLSQAFPDVIFDEALVKIARRDLTDYLLHTNHDLIMESGFGMVDRDIVPGANYEYDFSILGSSVTQIRHQHRFNSATYEQPQVPNISATWSNRRVKLKWNTKNNNAVFYGYELHLQSEHGGTEILDTLIVNPLDTSDNVIFHFIEASEILDSNDVEYTFKVYGRNFLDLRSEQFSEISGSSNEGITAPPLIEKSELLNTNEVYLEWSVLERFSENVREWKSYVGQNWDGPYEVDSIGISAETKSMTRPLPFENNYFRIAAIDKNGNEFSSFPTLVTYLDTIAPAMPTNIEATIDTNGIVKLSWDANDEKDFFGYKVFFGFDTTIDMTLANARAFKNPSFIDTIGLKSENRELYYTVQSVDNRNNRSDFSEIVELIKPDILDPAEPTFHHSRPRPEGTEMAWYRSVSDDVVIQRLFRKEINEVSWTKIQEWEGAQIDTFYRDEGLVAFSSYAYILLVEDASGNTSPPSQPIVVKTLPNHNKVNIEDWKIRVRDNQVEFQHNIFDSEIEEIRIFKKQNDDLPFELARISPSELLFIDEGVRKSNSYSYFIQILYEDGYKSKYSEQKTLTW